MTDLPLPEKVQIDKHLPTGIIIYGYTADQLRAYAAAKAAALEAEWKGWGIVEIAARNPSVAEYMRHWEGRTEAAEAECERLREDAERYRWGVKHARWLVHGHEAYVAIPVARNADLACEAMRTHAIDAALRGEETP